MGRDWERLKQKWRRWFGGFRNTSTGLEKGIHTFRALNHARWWVVPIAVFLFGLFASLKLLRYSSPPSSPYTPIVFDAPLPDPLSWAFGAKGNGVYFLLEKDPQSNQLILRKPAPGTKAFRGKDTVPIFGKSSPSAELLPPLCQGQIPSNSVLVFTKDGLILWPCRGQHDENQLELRRIGWRLPKGRWKDGLSLGHSAANDIVLGSSLLPTKTLSLVLKNGQLHISRWGDRRGYSSLRDLVCLGKGEMPPQGPCLSKLIKVSSGQNFYVYSRHHPQHAVTFVWQRSHPQESGSYELLLSPLNGKGLSTRHISFDPSPTANTTTSYAVGKATLYFSGITPGSVQTIDLSEKVHELILRQVLLYHDPATLQQKLKERHSPSLELDKLVQNAPLLSFKPYLDAVYHNAYLRNRIWMANRALAMRYKVRAGSLFRIRFKSSTNPAELQALGLGGATLRAPRRNLMHYRQTAKAKQVSVRLRRVLTAQSEGTPYLLALHKDDKPDYRNVFFATKKPLELLQAPHGSNLVANRDWQPVQASANTRTLLWLEDDIYQSLHPFAYQRKIVAPSKPQAKKKPTKFLYTVEGKWWLRERRRQKSSRDWPIEDIVKRLGTLITEEPLKEAIKKLNPRSWSMKQHCGNDSQLIGRRWRHRRKCWGVKEIISSETQLIVPCSELVRSRLRERFCKPGMDTPKRGDHGKLLRKPMASIRGMYGAVLLPRKERLLASGTSLERVVLGHSIRALPDSSPVLVNGQPLATNKTYPLQEGTIIQIGTKKLRYHRPDGILALARYRREHITSAYPEGPVFAHVIAGSVGGPFRSSAKGLREHLPPPPPVKVAAKGKGKKNTIRKIATTLQPDIQRIAFATARRHLARLDSPAFKKLFRRDYISNPHKPHAGAVLIMDRSDGRLLSALSFPAFDPNRPPEDSQIDISRKTYQHLQGQIVTRYGITDSLLAYDPSHLPPLAPKSRKKLVGRPDPIPDLLQALAWDKQEEQTGVRGDSRSGWLLERALGGAQTPGSTAKVVTAIAYARYLRSQGKPVKFPVHNCAGGMMFMRYRGKWNRRLRKRGPKMWRPSTIRFRCHKPGGHGQRNLKQALASSCNVYFAKLALEMSGVPQSTLRKGVVQWKKNRYGRSGKYQSLKIENHVISEAMKKAAKHRMLFQTAADLGFSMRYLYKKRRQQHGRYTDIFWQAPMQVWKGPDARLSKREKKRESLRILRKRLYGYLPQNYFGIGRFFGYASAYPAWQQWVKGATDPRYNLPTPPQPVFGSTDASIRGMAYIGFGQNLIASPLRLSHVVSSVVNGGWSPHPKLWMGDWTPKGPPQTMTFKSDRPEPKRVFHVADAKLIQSAMAAVTTQGTAAKPFRNLNRKCLNQYGLQVIGKTGTAETTSGRRRQELVNRAKRERPPYRGMSRTSWVRKSGCFRRRSWRYDYPEENIADSLFTGAIVPMSPVGTTPPPSPEGWKLQNLAFTIVVKNGYHPEGQPCIKKGRDLDRSEAKYLAHDILLGLIQHAGICKNYKDTSLPPSKLPEVLRKAKRKRRTKRTRRKRRTRTRRRRTRTRRRTRRRRTRRRTRRRRTRTRRRPRPRRRRR